LCDAAPERLRTIVRQQTIEDNRFTLTQKGTNDLSRLRQFLKRVRRRFQNYFWKSNGHVPAKLALALNQWLERGGNAVVREMQTDRVLTIAPTSIAGEAPRQHHAESKIPKDMRQTGCVTSIAYDAERLAIIPQGRVYSNKGLIVTPDSLQIQDFSGGAFEGLFEHAFVCKGLLPSIRSVPGKVAVFATGLGDCNYYHWTVENLPRIRLMEEAGISPDWFFLPRRHRFHRDSLELFGIPSKNQILANEYTHVQADELVIASMVRSEITPENALFLYQRMANTSWSKTKSTNRLRIYVARRRRSWRHVVNEKALLSQLSQYGFKRYFLEELPLRTQIQLFQQAEFVIGPHGAGLTNLVYCNAGTKVIEIGSPIRPLGFFYFIAHHRGLRYLNFFGKAVDIERDESNIEVDVPMLVGLLRGMDLPIQASAH
jgi:Glycosyltransferase 61